MYYIRADSTEVVKICMERFKNTDGPFFHSMQIWEKLYGGKQMNTGKKKSQG